MAVTRNQFPPLDQPGSLLFPLLPSASSVREGHGRKPPGPFSDLAVKNMRNVTIYKRKRDPVDASTDIIDL